MQTAGGHQLPGWEEKVRWKQLEGGAVFQRELGDLGFTTSSGTPDLLCVLGVDFQLKPGKGVEDHPRKKLLFLLLYYIIK